MTSPRPDGATGGETTDGAPSPADGALAGAVGGWLPEARWFAAKGRASGRIVVEEFAPLPAGTPGLALAIVSIADGKPAADAPLGDPSAGGDRERYVVPLAMASGTAARDAACDPAFAAWLVAAALGEGRLRGSAGEFRGHRVAGDPAGRGAAAVAADPLPEVTPIGGDASNTSFIVRPAGAGRPLAAGGPMVVKLIRRGRQGIQPEVEIGEVLAAERGWRGSPRLLGWLEHRADERGPGAGPEQSSTAIATVHELVPGCTSLWDRLVGLLRAGGLTGDAAGPVLRLAADLGRTTAELHAALAARADLPDFAPEPVTAAARRAAAIRMADHARRVFATAAARLPGLPRPVAARLAAVVAVAHRLVARLQSSSEAGSDAVAIRVHGDYHLGQVLFSTAADAGTNAGPAGQGGAGGRLFVIDFEGEPGRPLAERRAKATVFKDVAGMCRSFDYLLRHVARTTGRAPGPDDLRRLEAAFLDAYAAVAAGRSWWPADPAERRLLLDLHRLDKAIYELAYELDNRPDWVEVPLGAIEEMAAAPGS